jgi:hypothetical protein
VTVWRIVLMLAVIALMAVLAVAWTYRLHQGGRMPEYEVTWQMTGTTFLSAADELDVQGVVARMSERDLLSLSRVQATQVIATKDTS